MGKAPMIGVEACDKRMSFSPYYRNVSESKDIG